MMCQLWPLLASLGLNSKQSAACRFCTCKVKKKLRRGTITVISGYSRKFVKVTNSVVDPGSGSSAFLHPRSGLNFFRIPDHLFLTRDLTDVRLIRGWLLTMFRPKLYINGSVAGPGCFIPEQDPTIFSIWIPVWKVECKLIFFLLLMLSEAKY
jgi:hypothetical protein